MINQTMQLTDFPYQESSELSTEEQFDNYCESQNEHTKLVIQQFQLLISQNEHTKLVIQQLELLISQNEHTRF